MIICPNCKEEIEEHSHFCDQCGTALSYCSRCGRVGVGRRCTSCGGQMVSAEQYEKMLSSNNVNSSQVSINMSSRLFPTSLSGSRPQEKSVASSGRNLKMVNSSLDITILGQNGAVIGRRQGPYAQFFQNNMYVSGVHAQLYYKAGSGWYIVDKHSSNGTRLNNRPLQPDVEMLLSDGDVVMIANVNLKVSIN